MAKLTGVKEVVDNLKRWADGTTEKAYASGKNRIAPMLEQKAKSNRPWTDRTGAAKAGLHTKVELTSSELVIQLHHGVEYGIYLEMSKSGKYAILVPTVEGSGTEVMNIWRGIVK